MGHIFFTYYTTLAHSKRLSADADGNPAASTHLLTQFSYLKVIFGPAWCGSVDGAPACEPKSHRFNSQSGHTPGLQARSPEGVHERQPHIDGPLFLLPFPSL